MRPIDDDPKFDPDDPASEDRWLAARRELVLEYLREQGIEHRRLEGLPSWHLAPITSVWRVEAPKLPGWVAWWVVCGDHLTDHIEAEGLEHPRDVLRSFGTRWLALAGEIKGGEQHRQLPIAKALGWRAYASTIKRKAKFFLKLADDNGVWADDVPRRPS